MSERAPVGHADRGERSATNRYKTSSFVGVLVITSLLSPATLARDVDCVGQLGSRSIDGNLNVAVPCRLDGTTVKGNVRVFAGGSLIADRARIEGNLHARNADFVVLIETLVKGNVHLEQLVGDRSRIDLSDVDGNTRLTRNRTRLELQDGRFDGNVQVDENSGGVLILRNRIDGNLTCRRNDPAPVGSGNRVSGRSSDQCTRLSAEGSAAPTPPPPPPPPSNEGSGGSAPPADSSPPTPAPPQPAPPASGGGSGGSGSGGSGSGPTEPVLSPQPSGGGAAVGPLDLLAVLVLLVLLPFRRAR